MDPVYPYLLDGVTIEWPNQVWATDISYLPMAHGFLYLTAILDIASRKVLAWRLSNTLTTDFCLAALDEALARFGLGARRQRSPDSITRRVQRELHGSGRLRVSGADCGRF